MVRSEVMNLIKSIMTNNPCYKAGRKINVKGLMLHSVGCSQPSAEVFIKIWNKASYSTACVHGFIDANTGDIYQTLPWNHRGWHSGSGKNGAAHNTHIGVEMCEPSCITYTSGGRFTVSDPAKAKEAVRKTYKSAVELFAYLCTEYKLNPLADGVIISHSEGYRRGVATNHGDPEHLWRGLSMGYTMDGFRKDVYKKMNNQEDEEMTVEERKAFEALEKKVEELSKNQRKVYHYGKDVPEWAKDALWKAQQKGVFKGASESDFNVSEDTLKTLVFMDRAGVL
jgi:hypothetical protein